MTLTSVVIVGSGPSGIGVASLLDQAGVDYVVLERKDIGSSFLEWPEKMEMITPSFPSNAFGQMDLNSICESTSPAFSFHKEHLTGVEYAEYLNLVVNFHDYEVRTNTEVIKVIKRKGGWILETNHGHYFCKYLVWAAGEFQNPVIKNIVGAENCVHSAQIKYPGKLQGDDFVIVGGYESGVQLAFELIKYDKKVTLINPDKIDAEDTSDPSRVLSPYTHAKYVQIKDSQLYVEVLGEVERVAKEEHAYHLFLRDEKIITTEQKPICATGFSIVKGPVEEFISYRDDGSPYLKEETDELAGHRNIYLAGPSVRHDEHIFCFIYKFRQRFGVIVEDIMRKENRNEDQISMLVDRWKSAGMYLSDLSCCAEECIC